MRHGDTGVRWGSRFGFLMSAVGAAVGLGNLWAFPRRLSENGGGAYLLVYLLIVLLVGVPLLMTELAVGRMTRAGARGAYRTLPGAAAHTGLLALGASFCVLCFYNVLGGACLRQMAAGLLCLLGRPMPPFAAYGANTGEIVLCAWAFGLAACAVVLLGVSGGIERFSRVVMPLFLLLLAGAAVRALGQNGGEFLALLTPDFSLLRERPLEVLAAAGAQMLFSLSAGVGCMVTYGAYLPAAESIPGSALLIALADTFVALLAAAAVLPAGGGEAGPALLFSAMEGVFAGMGRAGALFGLLFYTGAFLAAITSAISYLETLASLQGTQTGRNRTVVTAALLALVLSTFASRDAFGAGTLLRFLDSTAEGVLIPLSALLGLACADLLWKPSLLWHELCQDRPHRGKRLYVLSILLFCPIVILIVIVFGR